METIEIVVDEEDKDGGTGANFVFDWSMKKNGLEKFYNLNAENQGWVTEEDYEYAKDVYSKLNLAPTNS
jgi:hypothetical protein